MYFSFELLFFFPHFVSLSIQQISSSGNSFIFPFQEIMESSSSDVQMSHCAEDLNSESTIEIKIKTLDSQTYNLRVNKRVSG